MGNERKAIVVGGLLGALLTAVTSNPLGALVGGLVAAFLACKEPESGAVIGVKAGLLAGVILLVAEAGGLVVLSLFGAILGALVHPGVGVLFAIIGFFVALLVIGATVLLSAIGGFVGGYLKDFNEQCPERETGRQGENRWE